MLKLKECPPESICPKGKLHDYKNTLTDKRFIVDTCSQCGHTGTWQKHNGKMLNEEGYVASHFRDFLQPAYPTTDLFREIYGEGGIIRYNSYMESKPSEPGIEDIIKEAKDSTKSTVKVK